MKFCAAQLVYIAFSLEEEVPSLALVAAPLQLRLTQKAASNDEHAVTRRETTTYVGRCFVIVRLLAPQTTSTASTFGEILASLTPVAAPSPLRLTYGQPTLRATRGISRLLTCSLQSQQNKFISTPLATEGIFSALIPPVKSSLPVTLPPAEIPICNAPALRTAKESENIFAFSLLGTSQLVSTIWSIGDTATVPVQAEQSCIRELSQSSQASIVEEALPSSRNEFLSEDKDENMTKRKKKNCSIFSRIFSSLFCCFRKQKN